MLQGRFDGDGEVQGVLGELLQCLGATLPWEQTQGRDGPLRTCLISRSSSLSSFLPPGLFS